MYVGTKFIYAYAYLHAHTCTHIQRDNDTDSCTVVCMHAFVSRQALDSRHMCAYLSMMYM